MSVSVLTKVWASSRASKGQLLVLLAIADFADDDGLAWPKLKILGEKSRLSIRETQRCLQQLEKLGELRISRRKMPHGGSTTNSYQILLPPGDKIAPPLVTKRHPRGDTHVTPLVTFPANPLNNPLISVEPSIEPSVLAARKARCSHHPGFDEFYERYPRKKAPENARKAWDKHKPPLQACLDALEWQRKEWNEQQFIPYPASWINAHSWEDVSANGSNGTKPKRFLNLTKEQKEDIGIYE